MYIDGQWIEAYNNARFDVFNPATGEKIGSVANGDQTDAARAIAAAARAFKSWSALTAYARSGYLYDAYRIMMERKEDMARVISLRSSATSYLTS